MKLTELIESSASERTKYKKWFNSEPTQRYLNAAKSEIVALELDINSPSLEAASTRALGLYNGMHRVFNLFETMSITNKLSGEVSIAADVVVKELCDMGYSREDAVRIASGPEQKKGEDK